MMLQLLWQWLPLTTHAMNHCYCLCSLRKGVFSLAISFRIQTQKTHFAAYGPRLLMVRLWWLICIHFLAGATADSILVDLVVDVFLRAKNMHVFVPLTCHSFLALQ
jgi:hypothetical protein